MGFCCNPDNQFILIELFDHSQTETMEFDIPISVAFIKNNALPSSRGRCALHVRLALDAGGVKIRPMPSQAKMYDSILQSYGFKKSKLFHGFETTENSCRPYQAKAGDIVVIQNVPGGRPEGHIAMFTGSEWVSDFKQIDMWGGPLYRSASPQVSIFRF